MDKLNKKIVIPAVGAILLIAIICLMTFNKKDNTPNNPAQATQNEQTNAGTDVNNLEEMNKLKQQQQEELQKQDELLNNISSIVSNNTSMLIETKYTGINIIKVKGLPASGNCIACLVFHK